MTPTTTSDRPAYRPSTAKRAQVWLANHFAILTAVAVLLYLFLPVAYTFVFSFNDHGKTNIVWQGFTWEHWQDPCGVPGVCSSLVTSLQVGVISTVVATVLGTLMALAMVRYRFRGKAASNLLIFVPMATPEIVMGAALLTIFVQGFSNIGLYLGFWTIVFAHIMFCLSFVVVTVRARIQSLDPRIEEAAQDLYASPLQTFWKVTFPLILPGILGAAMLAFSLSFDDFIITNFVSGNEATFPKFVYVASRRGIPAEANVIGFSMFVIAVLLVVGAQVVSSLRASSQQGVNTHMPEQLRVLMIGAGGVGDAAARIAVERDFFDAWVVADYDVARAERTVAAARARRPGDERFSARQVDASSAEDVTALARDVGATHVFNAVDPRFVMPIFTGALAADAGYLDMAMSLSSRHPESPYEKVGVKLGDDQLAMAGEWEAAGRLALLGIGVEPGLSDVFARYAADELFDHIDELGTRDGANLVIRDDDGNEVFAPGFSMWTIIEECLNPPVVWEKARADGDVEAGFFTLPPFSEPEVFDFPEGIGPVECVHVEHEEVLLMPRWIDADRVTFKYGLGEEMIGILRTLHTLGLDSTTPVTVKGVEVSPRDVVAACLPDPSTIGPRMEGKTCAGVWVTGTGKDGQPRSTYLYHVVDNADSMRDYGAQCVVWQTAINPVVALELIADGTWSGAGVVGPEALPPKPFLDLLAAPRPEGYGSPWGIEDREPGGAA